MKALYLTSKPVYPKIDGGCVAMASFLDVLIHAGLLIDHLTIATDKHPFNENDYPSAIRDNIKPEAVYINTRIKPLPALKYIFAKGSYNVQRFHSSKMSDAIRSKLKRSKYDIIILDSLYSTTYLDLIRDQFDGKIYLRSHNSEAQIWNDIASNERNLPKMAYLKKLAKDLEEYERKVLEQIDGVLALSPDDLELFNRLTPNVRGCVIPVTIDLPNESANLDIKNLFHLGSMGWTPNKEAVEELIGLFSHIRDEKPDSQLHIAGKDANKYFKSDVQNGIYVDGFVEDLNHYSCNAGIMVSPIRSGSGVRIKILEMMALGVPVVTTSIGAKGLFKDGIKSIAIADIRPAIVEKVIELINNKSDREKISEDSRRYIKEYHNIESASKEIVDFFRHT